MGNLNQALQEVQFAPFPEIFDRFRKLSKEYGGLPVGNLVSAFTRATGNKFEFNNPYIQNRRVKKISSLPENYSKDKVGEMLLSPDTNEQDLRQVEHGLEFTAYPLLHTRKMYQDLLTYHSYVAPQMLEKGDEKAPGLWREWRLLEKLRRELVPKSWAHQMAGQALQEGKVFYHPRVKVDKSHNQVDYAFLQQMPSDWVKIVGFNNVSKYTVSFNLFYFLQPGTAPEQFGNLFIPYLEGFRQVVNPVGSGTERGVVYASKTRVDLGAYERLRKNKRNLAGDPDVYYQNGRWFYWVTLPVDQVFPFEVDDAWRTVVSPFAGLFLNLIQLAQYEQVQLEIVQNPLISLVTGEIPYRDDQDASTSDPYKLSNAGRQLFEALWYNMLAENNTSGIGLFMAPLENMTMHTLAEAPGAMQISSNGYEYTMAKAGLSGIIPTGSEARAGMAQISLHIESKFAQGIYECFERMMAAIIDRMNLKYDWRFHMFGDLATDKELEESLRKDMTLGILPATIQYLALRDMSLLDDLCLSRVVRESEILDMRLPLVSTYSAKQSDSNLPPQGKGDNGGAAQETSAHELDPGGRPKSEGVTSEGQEGDLDAPTERL